MVNLCGCGHNGGFKENPLGWRGNSILSQCQENTQHQQEPSGAESAEGMLCLANQEPPQPPCHNIGSVRQTGAPCLQGRVAQGHRRHQKPPLRPQGLGKLPQTLSRGHLGEEDGVGQNSEHFLEKEGFKLEKRLLKQEETQILEVSFLLFKLELVMKPAS